MSFAIVAGSLDASAVISVILGPSARPCVGIHIAPLWSLGHIPLMTTRGALRRAAPYASGHPKLSSSPSASRTACHVCHSSGDWLTLRVLQLWPSSFSPLVMARACASCTAQSALLSRMASLLLALDQRPPNSNMSPRSLYAPVLVTSGCAFANSADVHSIRLYREVSGCAATLDKCHRFDSSAKSRSAMNLGW